jgi:hypothetical protein
MIDGRVGRGGRDILDVIARTSGEMTCRNEVSCRSEVKYGNGMGWEVW